MTPDQKACQEAFECYIKETYPAALLHKTEGEGVENPYRQFAIHLGYEAWKAAWRNRTEALKRTEISHYDGGEGGTFNMGGD